MDIADEFITNFKATGWESNPQEKILEIAKHNSEILKDLLIKIIEEIPEGGTYLDAAFSFLSEENFREVISFTLENIKANGLTHANESAIEYASIQLPQILNPHLGYLSTVKSNQSADFSAWPWRNADSMEIKRLESILKDDSQSTDEKKYAWEALIATSNTEALEVASQYIANIKDREESDRDFFNMYSMAEGFEWEGKEFNKLYNDETYHLCFPKVYFENLEDSWIADVYDDHPTWYQCKQSESNSQIEVEFGGAVESKCGVCGEKLHGLVSLETIPENLGVSGLGKFSLVTCLSCLSWEEYTLSFQHESNGSVESLDIKDNKVEPEFPAVPLVKIKLSIKQLNKRWLFQSWGSSNSRENLNRIGGQPSWIQDAEYESCPKCDKTMKFLVQLDSELPTEDHDEWLWGSGGILYVLWCDDCKISTTLLQCT